MNKKDIIIGLIIALFLAGMIAMFASPWPDGLEKVAEDKGFIERSEVSPVLPAPIPDYAWPGVKNEKLATSLAGIAGTLFIFFITYGISSLIKKR
jgi:cobalt/nickel transport protein